MNVAKYSVNEEEEHWIDAHCHLCNEPLADSYEEEIAAAQKLNINTFISTALTRKELDWHFANYSPEIKVVAGIHPYYDKSSPDDIAYFADLCEEDKLWGLGEIGFDNRRNNHNYQKSILNEQLELAQQYDLPVVFHVVRRYNELYQLLNNSFSDIRGYIHGFTGSYELIEMLCRLNIGFSIGFRILQQKDAGIVLNKIIKNGLYLFETDAPFQQNQKQYGSHQGLLNSLLNVVDTVSDMTGIRANELLYGQWRTYKTLAKP